jgi:beta-glucanase (GH16 family)
MAVALSATLGVASPASARAPTPVGGPGGAWQLAFDDEFSGPSLDLSTWQPNWFGSSDTEITAPVSGSSDSCTDPRMTSILNGELRLRVVKRRCNGHKYAGSVVSSNPAAGGNFQFTHGYIEFRAILPSENGIWSALWTNGQNWPGDGEIDVMESGLPSATSQAWYYHSGGGVNGDKVTIPNASTSWHTYAAFWESGQIRWYFDGRLVGTQTSGVANVPHYIVLMLSDWKPANPVGPAIMRVDYVRLWERDPNPPPVDRTASVSVSGSTLTVHAGVNTDNIKVTEPSSSILRVTDLAAKGYTGAPVQTAEGCTLVADRTADCDATGVKLIKVSSGDRADRVQNATPVKSTLHGGSGNDILIGGSNSDTLIGSRGKNSLQGRGSTDLLRARNNTVDTLIDCGAAKDKAELDELPKDPGSVVANCESTAR